MSGVRRERFVRRPVVVVMITGLLMVVGLGACGGGSSQAADCRRLNAAALQITGDVALADSVPGPQLTRDAAGLQKAAAGETKVRRAVADLVSFLDQAAVAAKSPATRDAQVQEDSRNHHVEQDAQTLSSYVTRRCK